MSEAKSLSLVGGSVILRLFCLFCLVRCRFSPESFINAIYLRCFFVSLCKSSNNQVNTHSPRIMFEAFVLAVLVMFMGYRLWSETWRINKLYMIVPVIGLVSVAILFPIQDQSIMGAV